MVRRNCPWMGFGVVLISILMCGVAAIRAAETSDPKALAEAIGKATGVSAGLCVHLGCGEGRLTAELGRSGKFVVEGLETGLEQVSRAREHIQAQGFYGRVAVESSEFKRLPYPENLANLIVTDDLGRVLKRGLDLKEVLRVLCPNGMAYLGQAAGKALTISEQDVRAKLTVAGISGFELVKERGLWVKFKKPRPAEMDDWAHTRHGADGNMVSKDTLGVPLGVRWAAGPVWAPHVWSRVGLTLNGLLFNITPDEGHVVARDAYNGVLLWDRQMKPPDFKRLEPRPQLMAAAGDRLYVVVAKKLQALDLATGKTVASFETEEPETVACVDGVLVVGTQRGIHAFDAGKNEPRWKHEGAAADVVCGEGRVFFLDIRKVPYDVVSLDLATGSEQWRTSAGPFGPPVEGGWMCGWGRRLGLCFYQQGVLALLSGEGQSGTDKTKVHGVSAKDGRHLWTHAYPMPPVHPPVHHKDVLFHGGLVWIHFGKEGNCFKGNIFEGLDPLTGAVQKRLNLGGMRISCQRDIATAQYIFGQKHFAFVDIEAAKIETFKAAGGACGTGGIVGNGLWYAFPFACGCNVAALRGFLALGPAEAGQSDRTLPEGAPRWETGPGAALGAVKEVPAADDWPTYRHDARRSAAGAAIPASELRPLWEATADQDRPRAGLEEWKGLGYRRITAPTVAGGKVFLAVPERHRVLAFNAADGKPLWSQTIGGRVDAQPTIHQGLCLVGSRDGWAYALRVEDGKLVWRYRAAPRERRIHAYGQMESVWPVVGGVLVDKDRAVFTAGRSTGADGGLNTCAVEVDTGKSIWEKRPPPGPRGLDCLNDTLVSDGEKVYLRQWGISLDNGENAPGAKARQARLVGGKLGIADESWCTVPVSFHSGQQQRTDSRGTQGQLLVLTPDKTYVYRAQNTWTPKVPPDIYAQGFENPAPADNKPTTQKAKPAPLAPPLWSTPLPGPMQVEALVLAGDTLLAAGPTDAKARKEGFILALSASDGKKLGQWPLGAPPIYEGLAVAGGRVYMTTEDGKVLCLGNR